MSLALSPPSRGTAGGSSHAGNSGQLAWRTAAAWCQIARLGRFPCSPPAFSFLYSLSPLPLLSVFFHDTPSLCFSSFSLYLSKNSPFAPKCQPLSFSPWSVPSVSVIPLSFHVPPLLSCFLYHPSCFSTVRPDCLSGAKSSCLTLCGRPHSAYLTCHVLCGITCPCVLQSGFHFDAQINTFIIDFLRCVL